MIFKLRRKTIDQWSFLFVLKGLVENMTLALARIELVGSILRSQMKTRWCDDALGPVFNGLKYPRRVKTSKNLPLVSEKGKKSLRKGFSIIPGRKADMKPDEKEKRVVCRDFLKNACGRGDVCKYLHPKEKYVFCHDYQNGKCFREMCAFVHCSREDEEHYTQTGDLPPHIQQLVDKPRLNVKELASDSTPMCKDFLKGECDRDNCKYRHVHTGCLMSFNDCLSKRRRVELEYVGQQYWTVEDENAFLRKTVAELRKRVDDLQATNEFLLEQNAQMRLTDKTQGLTAVTVPAAVTITNGQIQPQVSAAIRTVTASVATVPVSIAAVAAGTPVSIATVSMAPVIPAPSVTVAQHQDGSESTETAQTILSTTGPLVSYPIVARPVLPNL
ncbi:zinc finger CCCH domain-containing protein 10-like [Cimex lectularius]|uniref:C3H1-type domain-containing protein n=1 Tax=Cimex lectularius TaxID=79782 RepID=A0A8I6RVR9_CIMLE|nr:zinc finger CCCH domain-containing protein 10-like [Cimex lectularius]